MKRLLLFNLATDADDPILGFTTMWINALAQHCDAIDVITMRAGRLAVADNVRVYSVGKEKGYSEPRRAVQFYRILWRLLREHDYGACFAHMMPLFAVMGAPLLKIKRIPITLWYTHKSVTLLLRVAEKLVDRIVTASPESFRLKSSKTIVTGHGIDTNVFVPANNTHKNGPFLIVSIGRIAPIKRLELLIETAHILSQDETMPPFQVHFVGPAYPFDEGYRQKLEHLIGQYQLHNVVHFKEPVPHNEIVSVYQAADVMVNLSQTGSVDKAVLEAMSCGVLVLTSNEAFLDILPEVLDADAEMLGQKLKSLTLMPPSERQAEGQELRQIVVREHSLQKLSEQLSQTL